jgi:SAM-dependent methyltransferase
MDKNSPYPGRELESMAAAVNYRRWILGQLEPFLGRRIVEVGSGTGSFSELLLHRNPLSLLALEPSSNLYPLLVEKVSAMDSAGIVQAMQSTLTEAASQLSSNVAPDSILYINVLEHIEDDQGELRVAHSTLASGGRILIFVPAHQWLMGRFDLRVGHFRRYTRRSLIPIVEAAGFTIRFSAYFDILGIVTWWLKYRLFQSDQMEAGWVSIYDRWGVPVSRIVDSITNYQIGKNLIVIGEKRGVFAE